VRVTSLQLARQTEFVASKGCRANKILLYFLMYFYVRVNTTEHELYFINILFYYNPPLQVVNLLFSIYEQINPHEKPFVRTAPPLRGTDLIRRFRFKCCNYSSTGRYQNNLLNIHAVYDIKILLWHCRFIAYRS